MTAEKDDPFLPQSEHADVYDEWANQNGYTTERVEMKAEIARLTAALTDERARREEAEQKSADLISTNELLIEEFRKESARATAAEIRREEADREVARLELSDAALEEKLRSLAPHGSCACSYDKPGDFCQHHSPALSAALARAEAAEQELSAISAAIGSVRFMDLPDGGSVTLAEQVGRMRQALQTAEDKTAEDGGARIEAAARYVEALWNAHTREFGIYDFSTNATEFTGASEDIDRTLLPGEWGRGVMGAHEKHNELARRFVMQVVAETETYSEMIVVIESAVLACLMSLQRQHGFTKPASAAMIESAVQAAIERFVEAKP